MWFAALGYLLARANDRHAAAKACADSDDAIALSCFAGAEGVAGALPESFKVIPGMATVGTTSAYLMLVKGKIILDKTNTKVHRFKELNQTT